MDKSCITIYRLTCYNDQDFKLIFKVVNQSNDLNFEENIKLLDDRGIFIFSLKECIIVWIGSFILHESHPEKGFLISLKDNEERIIELINHIQTYEHASKKVYMILSKHEHLLSDISHNIFGTDKLLEGKHIYSSKYDYEDINHYLNESSATEHDIIAQNKVKHEHVQQFNQKFI